MVHLPANVQGKPTEKTMAPRAPKMTNTVRDGIVRGIPRHTTTHTVDGILTSACAMKSHEVPFDHKVKASATKHAKQEFGSGIFPKSAYGAR